MYFVCENYFVSARLQRNLEIRASENWLQRVWNLNVKRSAITTCSSCYMKALRGNFPRKFPTRFPRKSVHLLGNFLRSLLEMHYFLGKKFPWKYTDYVGRFPYCYQMQQIFILNTQWNIFQPNAHWLLDWYYTWAWWAEPGFVHNMWQTRWQIEWQETELNWSNRCHISLNMPLMPDGQSLHRYMHRMNNSEIR